MISIIIPVYNAGRFLEKCLSSILEQTTDDWECLLIDDGSTDDSAFVCDEWRRRDSRIKVFHQPNKGVSVSRNIGLNESKGKYVCFIDSDDWIEKGYLETMISASIDSDWVVSGQSRVFEDGHRVILAPSTSAFYSLCLENRDIILELERKLILYTVHEKLYRNDIIRENSIRFPEGCSYGEDLIFNYAYLEHVHTISTVADALYNYRMHDGSLSLAFRPAQFIEDYAQWLIVKEFHEKRAIWNNEVESFLAKRLWGIVYDGLFLYPRLEDKDKGYLSRVLSIPEIDLLNKHKDVFVCAGWIKRWVINRCSGLFYVYFKLFR